MEVQFALPVSLRAVTRKPEEDRIFFQPFDSKFIRDYFNKALTCTCDMSEFSIDGSGIVYFDPAEEIRSRFHDNKHERYVFLFFWKLSCHGNKLFRWLKVDDDFFCSTPIYGQDFVMHLAFARWTDCADLPKDWSHGFWLLGFGGRENPQYFAFSMTGWLRLPLDKFIAMTTRSCSRHQNHFKKDISLKALAALAVLEFCPMRHWKDIPANTGFDANIWQTVLSPVYRILTAAKDPSQREYFFALPSLASCLPDTF